MTFEPLTQDDIHQITRIRLNELTEQVAQQGIQLNVSDQAQEWLGVHGFQPEYGARPLTRLIKNRILHPASKLILDGSVSSGTTLNVDVGLDNDDLMLKLDWIITRIIMCLSLIWVMI